MSRRAFLGYAAAVPAVTYFLSPRGGWRPWEDDFTTDALVYKSYERMSFGMTDWRGIYGTEDGVSLNSASHPEQENAHGQWCNCLACAAPIGLNEESLEQMLIDIRASVDRSGKPIRLTPKEAWFVQTDNPENLKRFERQKPVLIRPGRRWFRA